MARNYLYILVLVYLALPQLNAMDDRYTSTNTYDGREITPDNLLELLESEVPLDPEDNFEIQEFIKKYNLEHILSGAEYQEEMFTNPNQEERRAIMDSITTYLEERNIPHINAPNSIIIIVNNKWVIKRSKVPIARQNILDTLESIRQGKKSWAAWMRVLTREEYNQFLNLFGGRVYQNISRAMTYLRARQAARLEGGAHLVRILETHLVHIPGRPFDVEDRNYVVVEEFVDEELTPLENSKLAVTWAWVAHMVRMIARVGWWNMQGNVHTTNDIRAIYTDHELPNRHDIRHVFHRDTQHFRDLVKHGWSELEKSIIKVYAQARTDNIKRLLEHNRDFVQFGWLNLEGEIRHYAQRHAILMTRLLEHKHALEQEIMRNWENTPVAYPDTLTHTEAEILLARAALPPQLFQESPEIISFFSNFIRDHIGSTVNFVSMLFAYALILQSRDSKS